VGKAWRARARVKPLGIHGIVVVGPTRPLRHARRALTRSCSRARAHAPIASHTMMPPAPSLVPLRITASPSVPPPPKGIINSLFFPLLKMILDLKMIYFLN